MRLADCCYRANQIEKGLLAIQRLEKEIGANQIYSVPLLKGKLCDQVRAFDKSADCFKLALNLFRRDFKAQAGSEAEAQIQFRLGWALIQSR